MQCSDCKIWCHFKCIRLLQNQLYIYDLTSREYACEQFVEVPDEVKARYPDLAQKPVETTSVRVGTTQVQT